MASDIYIEKEDLKNIRNFVAELRHQYMYSMKTTEEVRVSHTYPDNPDEVRRRRAISTNWPGDEIVGQLIKDAARLMKQHGIQPKELV